MKKVILFIAAAVVSVATAQAQSQDIVDIIKGILPKELVGQEPTTESATPVDEPVAESVEEPVVAEQSAAYTSVADVANAIMPAGFSLDNTSNNPSSTDATPIEQIDAYVGTPSEESVKATDTIIANATDVANAIMPAGFSLTDYSVKSIASSQLTPIEEIDAFVEYERSIKTRFLPMRQRVDRNIGDNKFVYKGECMLGLTASYGNISTENSDVMLLLNDINIGLRSATIRPFFAYAYRDNMAVGIRLGYQFIDGSLDNLNLDLGLIADGLEGMSISNLGLRNESFSWALFHRNYLGLDRRGIVGVIIESEILVKSGTSRFTSGGEVVNVSRSRNFAAQFNVNPGLGIYIFPQVCVTATVGIGGLRYNNVRQYDAADNIIGRRDHSSLNFKINITDIQIGVVAHLWNNKKK